MGYCEDVGENIVCCGYYGNSDSKLDIVIVESGMCSSSEGVILCFDNFS